MPDMANQHVQGSDARSGPDCSCTFARDGEVTFDDGCFYHGRNGTMVWAIYLCKECGQPAHGPGSKCRKDRRRTWTEMAPSSEGDAMSAYETLPAEMRREMEDLFAWQTTPVPSCDEAASAVAAIVAPLLKGYANREQHSRESASRGWV